MDYSLMFFMIAEVNKHLENKIDTMTIISGGD